MYVDIYNGDDVEFEGYTFVSYDGSEFVEYDDDYVTITDHTNTGYRIYKNDVQKLIKALEMMDEYIKEKK